MAAARGLTHDTQRGGFDARGLRRAHGTPQHEVAGCACARRTARIAGTQRVGAWARRVVSTIALFVSQLRSAKGPAAM